MKKITVILLSLVALATFITANAYAGGKPTPVPYVQFHVTISSVSADSISIQTAKGLKTYKITKYTAITYEGKTVTPADLKAGMKVSVTPGFDTTTAGTITASAPPKATPTPAKKK